METAWRTLFKQSELPTFTPTEDNSQLDELRTRFNELKRYVDELEVIINELIESETSTD